MLCMADANMLDTSETTATDHFMLSTMAEVRSISFPHWTLISPTEEEEEEEEEDEQKEEEDEEEDEQKEEEEERAEERMKAWRHDLTEEDKRLPHKFSPNIPVSLDHLKELGILLWKIDVTDWVENPELEKIRMDHGYIFWETITVAPGMLEDYEQKLHHFFQEHLHPYDESRLILDGSGYWDIRDYDGNWIRFCVQKGDMICLPAGMYHRFTVDTNNYVKALLLYKEVPRRVDVMKPDGDHLEVSEYIQNVLSKHSAHTPFPSMD